MPSVTNEVFEDILHFIREGYGNEEKCLMEIIEKNHAVITEM